jgi:thiol-disulfide isomerase/thioredoxin
MPAQNARRRTCLIPVLAVLVGTTSLLPVGAQAAVSFDPYKSLTEVLTTHAVDERVVMMVISQRDWCPPCIALDTELLRNPDEDELARLTEDWVVIEVNGYEEPWSAQLKQHGVDFPGTPTTLVPTTTWIA